LPQSDGTQSSLNRRRIGRYVILAAERSEIYVFWNYGYFIW
jgi:hypothetical protein